MEKTGWDEHVVRKHVKRCLISPVTTKRKLKPQWGLTSASIQGGGTDTRFTFLPGTIKTTDKLYDLMALKTVNWAMAFRDHKRQEASEVSPTTAQILHGQFPGHAAGKGDPSRPSLPKLRKWSWESRRQELQGREQARRVSLTKNPRYLLSVPTWAFGENWSRQVRKLSQAKERNT